MALLVLTTITSQPQAQRKYKHHIYSNKDNIKTTTSALVGALLQLPAARTLPQLLQQQELLLLLLLLLLLQQLLLLLLLRLQPPQLALLPQLRQHTTTTTIITYNNYENDNNYNSDNNDTNDNYPTATTTKTTATQSQFSRRKSTNNFLPICKLKKWINMVYMYHTYVRTCISSG